MRMLIVEDEHYVRERIATGINWASGQIDLVEAVENGREALAFIQRERLDLIITDINMPDMTGLELCEIVHRDYPHIKLIILTGYDDFEFARESIEYNVYKYLVKPVTNEQLWDVVQEVRLIHEQELHNRYQISLLEQRWTEYLPRLQEVFYKNWLLGRYAQWEVNEKSKSLNILLEDRMIWPILIDMDPIITGNERYQVTDQSLVQFSLFNLAQDIFREMEGAILQDDEGMTVVLLLSPTADNVECWRNQVQHQLQELLDTVKDCLKLTASAGIGSIITDKMQLPTIYKQCQMALQERIILGHNMKIHFRETKAANNTWIMINEIEKQLELSIEMGKKNDVKQLIEQVVTTWFASGVPIVEAKEVILRIASLLVKIVHAHGWTMQTLLQQNVSAFEKYTQLVTREQFMEWLYEMTEIISTRIADKRKISTQISKQEITEYVEQHLHEEELSLYLLADKLYTNYSYLSRTFKKIMGVSFSEYVWKLRMERAKQLLMQGKFVYDVAEQVGYRHVNYFSKAFAKYWNGVKPSEIKKIHS